MFMALIMPMLIAPIEKSPETVYSNFQSLIVADREDVKLSAIIAEDIAIGQGGPLERMIWGIPEEEEPEDQVKEKVVITKLNKLNYSNAVFPVQPADISSEYGWREAPCDECSSDHHGVDFVPGHGADVVSVLDGLVVEAGINGGFGTWVMIQHIVPSIESPGEFQSWHTIYAHLQKESIPENIGIGSVVRKGQLIGLVGNTGVSTGSHLHFEILIDDIPVDPIPLMAEYVQIELLEDGQERFIEYK